MKISVSLGFHGEREGKEETNKEHTKRARGGTRTHEEREKKEGFDAFFPLLLVKKRESCIYIYIYIYIFVARKKARTTKERESAQSQQPALSSWEKERFFNNFKIKNGIE